MADTDAALSGREPLRFTFPLARVEFADSGAGEGQFTVKGTAAVYGQLSADMGGFRWRFSPRALRRAVAAKPDVHLVIGHNMDLVLARTTNHTLELTEDDAGLHMWARVAPVSYAADLRVLMERGDVDQMSFSGLIDATEWAVEDIGGVETAICDVLDFSELLDVTICPQGAFPQTDSALAASYFSRALQAGRVPGRAAEEPSRDEAPDAPAGETVDAEQVDTEPREDYSRTARHARAEYERTTL